MGKEAAVASFASRDCEKSAKTSVMLPNVWAEKQSLMIRLYDVHVETKEVHFIGILT
jgi:hypothetical protein